MSSCGAGVARNEGYTRIGGSNDGDGDRRSLLTRAVVVVGIFAAAAVVLSSPSRPAQQQVRVVGLRSKPELNGRLGVVHGVDAATERLHVLLESPASSLGDTNVALGDSPKKWVKIRYENIVQDNGREADRARHAYAFASRDARGMARGRENETRLS